MLPCQEASTCPVVYYKSVWYNLRTFWHQAWSVNLLRKWTTGWRFCVLNTWGCNNQRLEQVGRADWIEKVRKNLTYLLAMIILSLHWWSFFTHRIDWKFLSAKPKVHSKMIVIVWTFFQGVCSGIQCFQNIQQYFRGISVFHFHIVYN